MNVSRAGQRSVSLLNSEVSVAEGLIQNDSGEGSAFIGTKQEAGCRCAACRAAAGILRVIRNFKQNDLFLVILPRAEGKAHIIRATSTLCRHRRFVPQHLLKRKANRSYANVFSCVGTSAL